MSQNLVCMLLALVAIPALPALAVEPVSLYVATNGNDAWSGKLAAPNDAKTDGPFATIERARDAIRAIKKTGDLPPGGVNVLLRAGVYALEHRIDLHAEDSGTAEAPITYGAFVWRTVSPPTPDGGLTVRPTNIENETVRVIGGKVVTGFKPVTDPAILDRLDEAARSHVLRADLMAQGITDYGSPDGGGMEVFFQDKAMQLARWPNEGFVNIVELAAPEDVDIRGTKGASVGRWVYDGDRPSRWLKENDARVHGYWFWDWSDQRHKIKSIDTDKHIIEVEKPYHNYGYRKGQWYYAFNILAELDSPGEWYVDRQSGMLYFWPPAPIDSAKVVVSILPSLLAMDNVSHVTVRGLLFENARGTAVTISGGSEDLVAGCVIRNCGGSAVSVFGGTKNGVAGCDIYDVGSGGISLSGGDRKTLEPAGNFADNNHIHDYGRWNRMYQTAVSINGVGNRATHNLIHDAPHIGIIFGGNEHLIEFNEIYRVCQESNDAGAIYAGRDWTMRGNIIRYNYLHDISGFRNKGCVGVYLDDMFASAAITSNVFYKVTMAAFIGGGRDCSIENNIFVDCDPALHIDARALNWAHDHADGWIKESQEKGTISGIAYNKPPYSERYPQLPGIIQDEPKAPKGNLIARNICVGGKWDTSIEGIARPYLKFENNLIDQDPHFMDQAKLDFRLKDDSPAFKLGFKPIPIEKIGLYQDASRASWPVER